MTPKTLWQQIQKEAQEYFLHFDRFLDNFTAFDAVTGLWRTLFGP